MITLSDLGRATIIPEAAQIDKVVLRVVGSIHWLAGNECHIAPVETLVDALVRGRSIHGRRMARSFRLGRANGHDVWELTLLDPQVDRRWSFGLSLKLSSPRASTAMQVPFELKIALNPTRQLAASGGSVPLIGAADCVLQSPRERGGGWAQSNMLPAEILVQHVANWQWLDAATVMAQRTLAFVVAQVFGEPETRRDGWVRDWEVRQRPPSISEVECFWEFSDPRPRQTVRRLCSAFMGGAVQTGAHQWGTGDRDTPLSLYCRFTQNLRGVLYPKSEAHGRLRLELRYRRSVATALPGIGSADLHDKFRMIAEDAGRRANGVLRVLRSHLRPSRTVRPVRYGELAGELARVLRGEPQRVADVMTELLTFGGITAGVDHLITINEANRLVRSDVLVRRRMVRSRHGRSFQLGAYFLPLCRPELAVR